jgi:uncharacterized FlaG/YvyC family protein
MSSLGNGVDENLDDMDGNLDNEQLENEEQGLNSEESDEGQANTELTEYQQVLEQLSELLVKVTERTEKLSTEDQATEQKQINDLFAQAKKLLKEDNKNINVTYIKTINNWYININIPFSLIDLAACFSHIDTVTMLLSENHLKTLLEKPENLGAAIKGAAREGHPKALRLLLNNPAVLNKIIKECPEYLGPAIEAAAKKGHDQTLGLLLNKPAVLNKIIKECPEYLGLAIEAAVKKGHDQTLGLLLNKPAVLKKVINEHQIYLILAIKFTAEANHQKSLELLLSNDKIINAIIKYSEEKNLASALSKSNFFGFIKVEPETANKIVSTRKDIVTKRNITTGIVAGIAGSTVGLGTIAGAFTAKLLASRSTMVKNCISLVVNCFLPIFNTINKLLMKISSKLDLNKLAKAMTNPKTAGLMIGVLAIFGAISSALGVGAIAHKKQGGTILGR